MVPPVHGRHLSVALVVLPISFVVITAIKRFIANRRHKLPPGPTPLPVLGNVLSVNSQAPWLTYTEWSAAYGDLVFVRMLDQEVVIINSQHVAHELLDKRSKIYSDRPYLATLEPFGWTQVFAFAPYGDIWRLSRRLFNQTFRPLSALKFRPLQLRLAHELVVNLIDDPKCYNSHFATLSSSVAMSAVYNYQSKPRNDPMVQIMEGALDLGLAVMTPEKAIILRAFPFLLKLPDWCWGSSIKRDARVSTEHRNKMVDVPFRYAQQHMDDDTLLGQSSMVAENLQRIEKEDEASKPMLETALKNAASTAIVGAYETTTSTLMVFMLAIVLYPDVQRHAQAVIDSVIGTDRLPTFEDRASIPYIDAVLRETLRWQPIVPLGVPHATSSADVYNGYFIPKGAIVMSNTWAISRDEKRYPESCQFMPERFLDVNGSLTDDDVEYAFGLGRRICPGRSTADASLWSAMVTMLATLDISSAKDEYGKVINFTPEFSTGLTRHPLPFPCAISARPHIHPELLEGFRTAV